MEKNSAQDEAIRTHKGQVLLIGCPGSGKTTTMIRRIHSMTKASTCLLYTSDAADD